MSAIEFLHFIGRTGTGGNKLTHLAILDTELQLHAVMRRSIYHHHHHHHPLITHNAVQYTMLMNISFSRQVIQIID